MSCLLKYGGGYDADNDSPLDKHYDIYNKKI